LLATILVLIIIQEAGTIRFCSILKVSLLPKNPFLDIYRLISKEEFLGDSGKDQKRKMSADGKSEIAFKAFDKNHDGYITKGEMLKVSKNLTKEQV